MIQRRASGRALPDGRAIRGGKGGGGARGGRPTAAILGATSLLHFTMHVAAVLAGANAFAMAVYASDRTMFVLLMTVMNTLVFFFWSHQRREILLLGHLAVRYNELGQQVRRIDERLKAPGTRGGREEGEDGDDDGERDGERDEEEEESELSADDEDDVFDGD